MVQNVPFRLIAGKQWLLTAFTGKSGKLTATEDIGLTTT
jgi:hypothetical protein